MAGRQVARPSVTSKRAPWRGHSISQPSSSPWSSGPPSCVQTSAMQWNALSTLQTASRVRPRWTTLTWPGASASAGPALIQLAMCLVRLPGVCTGRTVVGAKLAPELPLDRPPDAVADRLDRDLLQHVLEERLHHQPL